MTCRRIPVVSASLCSWWSTTLLLMCPGCRDGDLPRLGTVQYESDNYEIRVSNGLSACGGTYEYMEVWLAAFRERVGVHGHPARHTFHWLTPEDFGEDLCSGGAACAHPWADVIYSTLIPFEHEVVHSELDSDAPSVLVEGSAEVFGSIESPYATDVVVVDSLLDEERIPGVGYQTAGRLARFIIEQHGLDAYFELLEELDGSRGRDAIAEGVHRTLGVELSTLVADFESSSPCSVARWRYFDYECSSLPLTPWQAPTRWVEEIDLSCSAADVIGPRGGLVWTLRALEVEQDGSYQLTIASAEQTARVDVFQCDVECFDGGQTTPPTASVATGGQATTFLAKGRHWIRVEHSDASDASVTVAIEP
jgi:hypothetical protein